MTKVGGSYSRPHGGLDVRYLPSVSFTVSDDVSNVFTLVDRASETPCVMEGRDGWTLF
mgnify:CR=1 FL=1